MGEDGGAQQLLIGVVAQVEGHRLAPGERVHRSPGFGRPAAADELEHVEFEAESIGVGERVGVDAGGVCLEQRFGVRRHGARFFFSDAGPAERADELVLIESAGAEEFGDAALADAA